MYRLDLLQTVIRISACTSSKKPKQEAGFTLIEVLVVAVIIGVLSAIAIPGWLGFTAKQKLNSSTNSVFDAIRRTQSNAKRDKVPWQILFRYNYDSSGNLITQWSVHPVSAINGTTSVISISNITSTQLSGLAWNNLDTGVMIRGFPNNLGSTQLAPNSCSTSSCTTFENGVTGGGSTIELYRVVFDAKGQPSRVLSDLGKITMSSLQPNGTITATSPKNCVIVSTILGAARTAQDSDCDN